MKITALLGGAIALLGFLLIKAYKKIGKLTSQIKVERNLVADCKQTVKLLKDRLMKNDKIDNEPVSPSISDALDGMREDNKD